MRIIVLLLFFALVFIGGLFSQPVYKEFIEQDLTERTLDMLDKKSLRGIQISYDYFSLIAKAAAIYDQSLITKEIDANIWGAYVTPRAITISTKPPAKLQITIDRESKSAVLSGTSPDIATRQSLYEAVSSSESISKIDNRLVIDDRVSRPSWKNDAPAFISVFVNTEGTSKLMLNDFDGLRLEGKVGSESIKKQLGRAGAAFAKVENLLQTASLKNDPK